MQDAPFALRLGGSLIFVIVVGIVLWIATAIQIYILAWLLGLIGAIF
jgi:hypothetical protein